MKHVVTRQGEPKWHHGAGAGGPLRAPRIIPPKNRRLQVAPTSRKLFNRKAKNAFLEWFGVTCNASLSAAREG